MRLFKPRQPELARAIWQGVAYLGVVVVLVAARRARGDDELDPVEVLRRWDEGEGPPESGIDHETRSTVDEWA